MPNNRNGSGHAQLAPMIFMPDGSVVTVPQDGDGNGHCPAAHAMPEGVEIRPANFMVFEDGTKLELMRDPAGGGLRFLVWSGNSWSMSRDFRHGGKLYVPPTVDSTLLESISLPNTIRDCGRPSEIVDRLTARLLDFVDIPEETARLVSHFGLYTWFGDAHHVACYLWITGAYGSGKTTLLRFLGSICRRALLVSDATGAFLYSLSGLIRPTLMIDEFDAQGQRARDVGRMLRAGSTRGGLFGRGRIGHDTFGPKVIASTELPEDPALIGRAVCIGLLPSRKRLRTLDCQAMKELEKEVQPELLMFRLRHLDHVRANSDLVVSDSRMTEVLRALSLPLLGDKELETRLQAQLEEPARQASMERTFDRQMIAVGTMLRICHQRRGEMTCKAINGEVSLYAAELGEHVRLSDRKLGAMLNNFGIHTKSLGNWGRGIELTPAVRRKVHELAARHGLTRANILDWQTVKAGVAPPCTLCEEFGLLRQPGGELLRAVRVPEPKRRREPLFPPGWDATLPETTQEFIKPGRHCGEHRERVEDPAGEGSGDRKLVKPI